MWESEEAKRIRAGLEAELEAARLEAKEKKERAWEMGAAYGNSVPTWPTKETALLERCLKVMGDLVAGALAMPPNEVDNVLKIYKALRETFR